MPNNNNILGGSKIIKLAKPSTTKKALKKKVIVKKSVTLAPGKSKPVKVKKVKIKPVSIYGTTFVKSSYKHKPLKKLPKNPKLSSYYRGAEDKKLKDLAKFRGQLSPIIISDRSQCDEALGNIDCNGNNYCYICLSKLIPHIDVYTQCKNAGNITAWNTATHPNFTDTEKFYPQCEHVIACKTTSDDLNPWYMNFMMYSLHKKLLNFFSIQPEQDIRQFATTYTRPLPHLPSTDVKYLEYFLKIIIRMNYEWSHAICNNIKSNLEFANYISGHYSINNSNINHVLNMLFEFDTNYFDNIEVKLGNHLIPPNPFLINLNNLSASSDKVPIISEASKSINSRVQFILDELKYSRTLSLGGKGFNKFRHRSVNAPFASLLPTHGGGKADEFIRKIKSKNNNNNLNTNIDFNEIDIDFNSITIPDNENDFKKFIKNIHKTIFIEMLKKEANIDIREFERKITSVNIFIFTNNILDYLVRLISEFEIDDYFFQEVIHIFNSDINNIETNIKNLYEFIKINKKVNRDTNVYEDIKDAENKKSYEFLIKLMIDILYNNPTKDNYIKEFEETCIEELDALNDSTLKSDYLKFLSFNNSDILNRYKIMLENICEKTSKETIKKHLFIINFFKKIYNKLFSPTDEKDFYNMCLIYFRLCIGYGHLYNKNLKYDKSKLADSTSLNDRLKIIKEADKFLKKMNLSSEINQKDFKLLKGYHKYLSTIQESNISSK